MRTWFNRHFACVARVIQELRRAEPSLWMEFLVSHRHRHFAGYAVADEAFLEPAGLEPAVYLEWILETVRTRRVECIVPGHEHSLLVAHADDLAELGCRVLGSGPADVLPRVHRKDLAYEDAADIVDLPIHAVCHSPEAARRLVEDVEDGGRREVCLKPCVSVYGKGFTRITGLPHRATPWRPIVDSWVQQQAAAAVFPPHLIMEFLPGHEYSVDIAARQGTILAAVVRRKPLVAGGQVLADSPSLIDAAERLVRLFRLNAIVNVQFREDTSGVPRLLEINPRASGGIGMSCLAGVTGPAGAYRGLRPPPGRPPAGALHLGCSVLEIPKAVTCPDPEPVSPEWSPDVGRGRRWQADATAVDLPSGRLSITVDSSAEAPLGELLGFGARRNPKRGFLLVSKVLGKHWPCRPGSMARVRRRLAERLANADLHRQGFVVVGMAETATGLGQGVFESLLDVLGPGTAGVFAASSRYLGPGSSSHVVEFGESHSHGPQLVLTLPAADPGRARMREATTLVLCDDEVSTGSTFANLVTALRPLLPAVRRVLVATIADLSGGACRELLQGIAGVEEARVVSLMSGSCEFEWNPDFDAGAPAVPPALGSLAAASPYSARGGVIQRLEFPAGLIEECLGHVVPGTLPILVVGTGEFMHAAFRLAMALESRGLECRVQSTTRSPLLIAGDIRSVTPVPDLTGGGVPHALYNFDDRLYRQVVVAHESPLTEEVDALCAALAGTAGCLEVDLLRGCVRFRTSTNCSHQTPAGRRLATVGGVA